MKIQDKISGVYAITNLSNGHRYIGSSIDIYRRWGQHRRQLRKGTHSNQILQRAWDKYSEDTFEFSILIVCSEHDTLLNEQEYLNNEKPEYNIAINARAPMLGIPMSEECKQKIGNGQRGRVWTDEERNNLSKAQKGKHAWTADDYKKHEGKMPDNTGRVWTEESKRKASESHKGKPSGWLGKHHSEESKRKMSEARKGMTWSDARRKACDKARSRDGS